MSTLRSAGRLTHARLSGRDGRVELAALAGGSSLGAASSALAGRTIAIATRSQLAAALAMVELDGLAGRLVVCPPDLPRDQLAYAMAEAGAGILVTDWPADETDGLGGTTVRVASHIRPRLDEAVASRSTEWVLFTSGTSGVPKMVVHSLAGLAGAIAVAGPAPEAAVPVVWSTFYDIRRYGGLQIFLRAMLGGSKLVLSDHDEPVADFLARASAEGVTHISGTPSHWRRVLMRPPVAGFEPGYIRLSGEIADQAVLDALAAAFPSARIVHAFASTEAGVGFEVTDGREGFPAAMAGSGGGGLATGVELKVEDDTLRIRSPRTASAYLGPAPGLAGADGFVDTGDMVELRGDRYHFVGRRGGIINVGGLKVNPEEVEAVINRHPAVQMSLVKARRNPMTGAIVVAEIVLKRNETGGTTARPAPSIEQEIRSACRAVLPAHKVPAIIKFVATLAVTAGGKLARQNA